MSQAVNSEATTFVLPPSVVSKADLARLVTELEAIDNLLTAADVRARAGVAQSPPPAFSDLLADFMTVNQLQLGDGQQRSQLLARMRRFKDTVPTVHMTFAAPADHESLQQLAAWLRQSVHPQAVIAIGLQPSLIGGVYVRTTNHVHDLSVRAQLAGHRDILVRELEMLNGAQ